MGQVLQSMIYGNPPPISPQEHERHRTNAMNGLVKFQNKRVSTFDGDHRKWKVWKKKTIAAMGTAGLDCTLMNHHHAMTHPVENQLAFYQLQIAAADGDAAHLVDECHDARNRHAA